MTWLDEDPWSPQARAAREAEELQQAEQERHAAGQLLRQRGHDGAALIVASSSWRSRRVDGWAGGQYEVEIAVPAELYDAALHEAVLAELTAAAKAIVGSGHFHELSIALRHSAAPYGWDAAMAADIIAEARGRQAPPVALEG